MRNQKTVFWINLVVSLVLIVVGAFLVGFVGFNGDSTTSNTYVIEVRDMLRLTDDARDALQDYCTDEISGSCAVVSVKASESSATGATVLEFSVAADSMDEVASVADALGNSIASASIDGVDVSLITVAHHDSVNVPYYTYLWRTAIGLGASLVLLFLYTLIRFKLSAGVSVLVAGVHDMLLTLALVAILRIPAGIGLIGVATFSFLFSAFTNLVVFGKVRGMLRAEDTRGLPAGDMARAAVRDRRGVILMTAAFVVLFCVILGVVGFFISLDLTWIMLATLLAAVVSVCSSLFLSPSLYVVLKG